MTSAIYPNTLVNMNPIILIYSFLPQNYLSYSFEILLYHYHNFYFIIISLKF